MSVSGGRATDTEPARLKPMKLAAEIVVVLILVVPIVVFGYLFVWAARKDGEDDQALQRRLGIRRKTRLGR
jgi:Tfp pilus assembly protein PilO